MMDKQARLITDPEYGYVRVDPIPTPEEVERYYEEEFYAEGRFNDSALALQQQDKAFFDQRWEGIWQRCNEHFGGREFSLFDVGFGYAQALLYWRDKGVEVSGLDPAPQGVAYAREQGLDVFQAGIEDFGVVGERRFDVVTILNVLEHLRHPPQTLRNIADKLLKPGGLLVVEVPNEFNDFQTTADAEFGLGQWWVCPPAHLNYFSNTSLESLLEQCDYSVQHSEASFPLELFMLLGDVYVGNGDLGRQCHLKRVQFEQLMRKHGKADKLGRFYQALAELDLGRQTLVFASARP
jgi:2-polyprenyl-3-methyl-5-hydroxy-6-metoxy-1,4-benzoquinol methylase